MPKFAAQHGAHETRPAVHICGIQIMHLGELGRGTSSSPREHARPGCHDEAAVGYQRDRGAVALAHALSQLQQLLCARAASSLRTRKVLHHLNSQLPATTRVGLHAHASAEPAPYPAIDLDDLRID